MTDTLIVGGGGYIGRHVCNVLDQHEIDFHAATSKRAGSGPVMTDSRRVIHNFDITDPASTDRIAEYSQIILLASASVPATFASNLNKEISHNLGPYSALLSKIRPGSRVIYLSSGGTIYGEAPEFGMVSENDANTPKSTYGLVKLFIEETIRFFAQLSNFSYVILRPSNPVGPHLEPSYSQNKLQGVISSFLNSIKQSNSVTVIGDGSMERDYFDVRDLAKSIMMILKNPSVRDVVWNVGSGVPTSINDIIDIMKLSIHDKFELIFMPSRPFDVNRNVLNISNIRHNLNWNPEITLEQSILDTWNSIQ